MKFTELNPDQIANAKLINKALLDIGLTNPFLRAGILAVASKESGFKLFHETSYRNTPNDRILSVFGADRFRGFDVGTLKKNDVDFFNLVYNRKDLGNGPFDGYKFRGRGFNQLTGRYNYSQTGSKIGFDLIANPDLLDSPEVAAKALAQFFRGSIVAGQMSGKFLLRYGILTTGQIKDIQTGAHVAHWANAGFGVKPENDPTGGWQVTSADASSYLPLTQV